jgi:uncharacterized protein (DUF305 family)
MRIARHRRLVAAVFAALGVLTLAAGCGGDDGPTGTPTPTPSPTGVVVPPGRVAPVPPKANFNAADVLFAQDMLLSLRHTEQLAKLAQQRATDPKVKALAANVLKQREAGLVLLPMWLERYKQPMPSPSPLPGQTATGAPSAEETTALTAATGDAFDRLFLQLLGRQDTAGMKLVTDQQWNGKNGPLISLSHKLQDDFEAELAAMRPILGG